MTLNIIRPESMPARPYPDELYNFSITAIPALQYGIWLKSQPYYWLSDDDTLKARSVLSEVGAALLMPIGITLHNDMMALYNLLDAALGGIERSVTGTGTSADPFIYDRPIPQVKTRNSFFTDVSFEEGMLVSAYLTRVKTKATDDDLYAIFTGDTAGSSVEGMRVTYNQLEDAITLLQAIIDAMPEGGPSAEQIAEIIALLGV